MVWLALRADLRLRWRSLLGLALLLGLTGGAVLTAAAGAQRTDTAYPRLLAWANASQVDILPTVNTSVPGDYFAALGRLPQVAALATETLYQVALPGGASLNQVSAISSPDHALGISVDRVKVVAGRVFDPYATAEAMIDPQLAAMEHLQPGGTLRLLGVPNGPDGSPEPAKAVTVTFRVTAIVVFDDQVVSSGAGTDSSASEPTVLLSSFPVPGAAQAMSYGTEAAVRLRPGTSVAAFSTAASTLARRYRDTAGGALSVDNTPAMATAQQAIRPLAVALAAFAGLVGLIALAVLGQLLSRQLALDAAEFPVLRAIGADRGSLVALSLARLAVVSGPGGALAVAVAVAASPLMPVGPARLAEPSPGVAVSSAVLAAGFAGIALLPVALLVGAAWRAASQAAGPLGVAEQGPAAPGRRSRVRAVVTTVGSLTSGIGTAMAFEPGHGRTAVPVRSALAGCVTAVAALTAAVVFGASLISLVGTPSDYGQNWNASLDLGYGGVSGAMGAKLIAAAGPSVAGYAAGDYGQLQIGGTVIAAVGVDQPGGGRPGGGNYLTVLAGRPPAAPDEIALGAQTLRAIGGRVGEVVPVTIDELMLKTAVRRYMRIVGVAVLPDFGRGTFTRTGLGTGAVVTAPVLSEYSVPDATTLCRTKATCYNFFLLRLRKGAGLAAVTARLTAAAAALGCPPGSCLVTADQRPGAIRDDASVRDTPLALAVVLSVLGVGTLAHVLLTGVRRRRRDLALLKILGFTRPQVLRVVAWEASAFAVVAVAAGLPLGILGGRAAWAVFADSAGVAPLATVPLATVLLVIPVTLLLANLIAAWPGWQAARLRPAAVLRAE